MHTYAGRIHRQQQFGQISVGVINIVSDRCEDPCVGPIGGPAQMSFGYRLPGTELLG